MGGKIIVLGNSHVQMLRQKIVDDRFSIHWINFGIGPSARHGDINLDQAAERAAAAEIVVITLLGSDSTRRGLLRLDEECDVMLPGQEVVPDGVTLIPYNAMLNFFLDRMRANEPVPRLAAAASGKVFHIATPPPRKEIVWDRPEERPPVEQINPAPRRLRLWQVEMRALQIRCEEMGMEFLPPPGDIWTEEGYLHPDYAAKDALHGNKRYGELVLRQLSEKVALAVACIVSFIAAQMAGNSPIIAGSLTL